jgi:hypothetical protein
MSGAAGSSLTVLVRLSPADTSIAAAALEHCFRIILVRK